jgi:ABC-2 type transport system ATP-binding protein
MAAPIVLDHVEYTYGSRFKLGPLSLELGSGVTCLVGANGAGKSTLFSLLAHQTPPSSGSVTGPRRASLGFLPQDATFPRYATVRAYLSHVAWLQRLPGRERAGAVERAVAAVGLTDRIDAKLGSLSGGMLRRVGIAQAIVNEPQLLLLDEPTAGLDPIQRVEIRQVLRDIGPESVVVMSTHLVEDVRGLADRVIILSHGALRFDGSVDELQLLGESAGADAPGDSDLERGVAGLLAEAQPA